ncbi:hypothetical protein NS226_15890 [Aureimonas ureilytica]|uniref:HPr kinase/phosphorylase C-terminal domain-containing protein n=1 Tax=Aureimonas ureilytica TaxID=401562 RepID=A0A175R5H6_9HYPH|nr:hypothetical protein [Aureimonas ureilytica]KTQ90899.1 hypothetical protein NS226_15890 [Aureimonas ureilytica]
MPAHLHATLVVIDGAGILIRGASGGGKSSLAISLLRRAEAAGHHARLVADDQVFVEARGEDVFGHAPPAIAGLIEIRGVGILQQPFAGEARVALVVDLSGREALERLPEPSFVPIAGLSVRRIHLPERDPAFGADVVLTVLAAFPKSEKGEPKV